MASLVQCFVMVQCVLLARAAVLSIEDFGAQAQPATNVSFSNRDAVSAALAAATPGDTVLVPAGKEYTMVGGASCTGKKGVTLSIQGGLVADPDRRVWPLRNNKDALHFITIVQAANFTVTGGGHIEGNGMTWWDGFIWGELPGSRPRLVIFDDSSDVLFESLTLRNSADQNINFNRCARVEVRFINIVTERFKQRELKTQRKFARARDAGFAWALERPELRETIEYFQHRGEYPGRTWKDWVLDEAVKLLPAWLLEPEDLNTDGIDPSGIDFYIHDCNILNDDDSIAVKPNNGNDAKSGGPTDCTQNILVENMVLTGFGASIGSVPPSADTNCVRNVTFRNISMPNTGKGIYIKSNPHCGQSRNRHGDMVEKTSIIDNIAYEDVTLTKPFWWPIWIGPQQQHEPGSKLGEDCAITFPLSGSCPTQGCATFRNIRLRNVQIHDPFLSPGVIMGNETNPMKNLTFDNVVVDYSGIGGLFRGHFPYRREYLCHDAEISSSGVNPVPCRGGAVTVV